MNWSDLESIWKCQELPAAENADLAALRQTFEVKRRKMAASLYWRDLREAIAGLSAAGFFSYAGWHQGKAYWPFSLAVLLILGVTTFFILERIRARRERLGSETPLLAKLEADIAELNHQRRLLLNIATWYLAPCIAAWAIVLVTVIVNKPPAGLRQKLFLGCYVAFCAFLTWGIWALNRRAARKKIEPRIIELERLRNDLLSTK